MLSVAAEAWQRTTRGSYVIDAFPSLCTRRAYVGARRQGESALRRLRRVGSPTLAASATTSESDVKTSQFSDAFSVCDDVGARRQG